MFKLLKRFFGSTIDEMILKPSMVIRRVKKVNNEMCHCNCHKPVNKKAPPNVNKRAVPAIISPGSTPKIKKQHH